MFSLKDMQIKTKQKSLSLRLVKITMTDSRIGDMIEKQACSCTAGLREN